MTRRQTEGEGAPALRTVPIDSLQADGRGWHYDDGVEHAKLLGSIRRFGQLRPVVVCTVAGELRIVDGHRVLAALREAGASEVRVADLGERTAKDLAVSRLACLLQGEVDYATVVRDVGRLIASGEATAAELSAVGPFRKERLELFPSLLSFDFAQFSKPTAGGQLGISWLSEPEAARAPDTPAQHADAAAAQKNLFGE